MGSHRLDWEDKATVSESESEEIFVKVKVRTWVKFIRRHLNWGYENPIATEVEAVDANEPVRRGNNSSNKGKPVQIVQSQIKDTKTTSEVSPPKEYITYNLGNKGRSVQIEITIRSFAIINNTVFTIISNLEWLPSTKKEDDEDPTLEGNEGARNSSSNGLPPGNLYIEMLV